MNKFKNLHWSHEVSNIYQNMFIYLRNMSNIHAHKILEHLVHCTLILIAV